MNIKSLYLKMVTRIQFIYESHELKTISTINIFINPYNFAKKIIDGKPVTVSFSLGVG